jgi:hypothetical protein
MSSATFSPVYPRLCLSLMGIVRRPVDLIDLRRLPGLVHASDAELLDALGELESDGRVSRAVVSQHYRLGSQRPARDVTVWTLEGGLER